MSLRTWHIGVLALLFFVPGLGLAGLFDWDEVNFAEAAREMLVSGQYGHVQIDFKPFWEKPPLFFWLQVLAMKWFGVGEFAARLPNALAGAFTLMLLHKRGTQLGGGQLGLLWVLVYVGSMLPQFYFRSGIIDPWFNLFLFFSMDRAVAYFRSYRLRNLMLAALGLGLAVLTKGPVGVAIFGAVVGVWVIFNRKEFHLKWAHGSLFFAVTLIVGFSWFGMEILEGRTDVLLKYIDYHRRLIGEGEAGHAQPFYFHFVVLLVGCFPMSGLFLGAVFSKRGEAPWAKPYTSYRFAMHLMFWVVLFGFSLVKTKIIHYSSLCYLPMSFVVASDIDQRLRHGSTYSIGVRSLLVVLGVMWGVAISAVALFEVWRPLVLRSFTLNADTVSLINNSSTVVYGASVLGFVLMAGTILGNLWLKNDLSRGGLLLFATTGLVTWGTSLVIMPKVYEQVQGPLRQLYQTEANKGVLVQPLGYHSYAHLFYGNRSPEQSVEAAELQHLISGPVRQPVLFLVRHSDLKNHLRWFPDLVEKGRVGDKVILERTDPNYRFGSAGK